MCWPTPSALDQPAARGGAGGARLPGGDAVEAHGGAAGGRARRGRAGQHARHHRPASELAAQVRARARRTRGRSRPCATCAARLRAAAPTPRAQARTAPRHDTLIPRATYRLQFHSGFGFDDAIRIVPYLARLGISHVYCSPIQRARPGSMHGYDVVAHDEINPELGGAAGLRALHAGAEGARHGPAARPGAQSHGRAGRRQPLVDGRARERRGLALCAALRHRMGAAQHRAGRQGAGSRCSATTTATCSIAASCNCVWDGTRGEFALHYHDAPLSARAADLPGGAVAGRGPGGRPRRRCRPGQHRDGAAATSAARCRFGPGPGRAGARQGTAQGPAGPAGGQAARRGAGHRRRSGRVQPAGRPRRAARAAGGAGLSAGLLARGGRRDQLPALLRHQRPRGAAHRARGGVRGHACAGARPGGAGLGRRACASTIPTACTTRPAISSACSKALRCAPGCRWSRRARMAGRRARSTWSPKRSRRRTRKCPYRGPSTAPPAIALPTSPTACWSTIARPTACAASGAASPARPATSRKWPTTAGAKWRAAPWRRNSRCWRPSCCASPEATAARATTRSTRCAWCCRRWWPAWPSTGPTSSTRRRRRMCATSTWRSATRAAAARWTTPPFSSSCAKPCWGRRSQGAPDDARVRVLRFATRFQQFSAPVAAKGVEDTAFYRYFPLSALNEVGGDPDGFGMTVPQFHEASADRARRWPHTMLATSTHDNKRSEDVRLRIDVLSEMPARWRLALRHWRALNDGLRAPAGQAPHDRPPSAAHEYLFYQTVLGTLAPDDADAQAHADYVERIVRYMLKAAREGKTGTSWTQPREDYETGARALRARGAGAARVEPLPGRPAPVRGHAALVWRAQQLHPGAAQVHLAGRSGPLPGQRADRRQPGRPRQPAPGRLRGAGAVSRRTGRARRRRPAGPGPAHCTAGRRARRRPGQAVADLAAPFAAPRICRGSFATATTHRSTCAGRAPGTSWPTCGSTRTAASSSLPRACSPRCTNTAARRMPSPTPPSPSGSCRWERLPGATPPCCCRTTWRRTPSKTA